MRPLPKLRQKRNGAYFVRLHGHDHYLSVDHDVAQRKYRELLAAHLQSPVPRLRSRTVLHLAREMLEEYQSLGRGAAGRYFRVQLTRWLNVHGGADAIELASSDPRRGRFVPPLIPMLIAFRSDLSQPHLGLARRTVNHDLVAVKRLFNWAAERGYVPAVNWRGVKRLPVARSQPEDLPEDVIRAMLACCAGRACPLDPPPRRPHPALEPWLALQYLACLRTSEVVRLVHGRGRFRPVIDESGRVLHPRGLFELTDHKNSWRGTEEGRFVVLTEAALRWLACARPVWGSPGAYQAAVLRACPWPPRVLRDSAASHLRARGVALEGVQTLLGHNIRGEWPSYARTPWPALRTSAARLSL